MIASKNGTYRNFTGKAAHIHSAAEPKLRRRVARLRRRKLGVQQDAMLHNWLLEKDDCS